MTITIYTKPSGCFGCKKTKDVFDAAGVSYIELDITTNQAALEYVNEELGYSQAPIVLYEREGTLNHWSGLNPTKINQVIALELAA
ncbi:glutaredoxin family protein [Arthrobacter sp. TMP15]|uniref:glutaredoxin family protein n=1 Tax=Arthrobacter sp. TMP15 TaxID=3140789 RepID=UPI0031BA3AE7